MSDPIIVRPQTTIVRVSSGTAVVRSPIEGTQIVQAGIQGQAGRDGIPATLKIAFAFGDATPKAIANLPANTTVFTAQVIIQIPLNGLGAALSLGDAEEIDRLISSSQVDPTFIAEYETNPGYTYSAATQVLLTITPGEGCTQGAGYILLEAA